MHVKELRNWLSDFGEKNKKHYQQGKFRSQNGELDELLIIQSKPSTASTSPSSSRDGSSPREDESFDRSNVVHSDWDSSCIHPLATPERAVSSPSVSLYLSEYKCFDQHRSTDICQSTSPSSNCIKFREYQSKDDPTRILPPDGAAVQNGMPRAVSKLRSSDGKETIKMNMSADPTGATQENSEITDKFPRVASKSWDTAAGEPWWNEEQFSEATFAPCESNDEVNSGFLGNGRPSQPRLFSEQSGSYSCRKTLGGIHVVENMDQKHLSLFCKQTPVMTYQREEENDPTPSELPTEAFDSESKIYKAALLNNKTLTSGTLDFICRGEEEQSEWGSSDTVDFSDDGTNSSWSQASLKSSIVRGALESKLGRFFLQNNTHHVDEHQYTQPKKHENETQNSPEQSNTQKVSQKKLDPNDLPFLQPIAKPITKIQMTKEERRSSVSIMINTFGGPGKRQSIVDQRKDQLTKLFSENKAATYVTRKAWGVCPKTGIYKKKTVLDVQFK